MICGSVCLSDEDSSLHCMVSSFYALLYERIRDEFGLFGLFDY